MEYLKIRKDLMFLVNPLVFIVGLLIFCKTPQVIPPLFRLFWIATVCAAGLIITPFGHRRLTQHNEAAAPRLPWQQWIFCIALVEVTLLCVYLGISNICGTFFLVNTPAHPALFTNTVRELLLQDGLFPWSLYALIAAGMGWLAYHDHTNAYFSNLLKPFTKQEPDGTYSLIANIGMRRCVLFSVSVLFFFLTLLLISFFLPLSMHVVSGFQSTTLLVTLVLLFLPFSDTLTPYIFRFFSRRTPTLFSFPVFCIVLAIIVVILSALSTSLWSQSSTGEIPLLIRQWISYDWSTAWILFSISWWLCLTPLVAVFIARVSRGYRIREVILGTLLLPMLLVLF